MKYSILLFCLLGCSTTLSSKATLICDSANCPSQEQLDCMMNTFADAVPGFDVQEDLKITWRDRLIPVPGNPGSKSGYASGLTWNAYEMEVVGIHTVGHELIHVQLFRVFGDGDVNHEQEGGYWRQEHHNLARDLAESMADKCEYHYVIDYQKQLKELQ